MWVIFNKYNLSVVKTCDSKAEAQQLLSKYLKNKGRWTQSAMSIEKFELGNLDAWVTWKHLTKGPYE